MATDGPDPTPCNMKVFNEGELMMVTHTIGSNSIEGWVKKIAKKSGQPVDWHFAGGRARILALGDLDKVNKALWDLLPEHNKLYRKACSQYGFKEEEIKDEDCPQPLRPRG
jgi:hypothetical protein